MDIKCVYISVLLMVADGFTVRGSSGPLVAPLGSSVVLPCYVDELLLMEGLEVEWRRTDLTPEQVSWKKSDEDEDILVLLYQNKQTLPDSSDEHYRDRVEFFTAEILKGNFSLRLKGVRAEDRGVYVCQVFAGELSANATVVLKTLGFSSLHVMVLVFCFAAGSGAVLLLCCLIYCRSTNTVSSSTIWSLQLSLVFCPNICMSFAFIFCALTEGFLHETITCCALYILRPVMLIWALPCLNYLQGRFIYLFFN
ncbi:butyrophilin subfamily 2 member A2-like [Megalobrama amblycephala]|uniref:butyrophilin subfamily 2 member A2-like n=1 Tax=Megalobrama amblycephala TaxID=75352 RepID=UPI002014671B|nr:butyrophilin subfamily 2 member A2-like [Megalobrama amblycephala]